MSDTLIQAGNRVVESAWVTGETKVVVVVHDNSARPQDKRYEWGVVTKQKVAAESRMNYTDPFDALRDALIWVRCKSVLKEILGGWHLILGQVKIHDEASQPSWDWYRVKRDATP